MVFRNLMRVATGLVAPFLAACDDAPRVTKLFTQSDEISWSLVRGAAARGPVLANVAGNPFAMEAADFTALVHAEMTGAVGEFVIRYTDDPGAASDPAIHMLLVFGAPKSTNGNRLCQGRLPALETRSDRLSIRGVLCSDEKLLADVSGSAPNVEGPEDKKFKRLVFDTTRMLVGQR